MNPTLAVSAEAVLAKLQALEDSGVTDAGGGQETVALARDRRSAILKALDFLRDREHPLAFIGSVGVGKSSLIGVIADLVVGHRPTNRTALKESSVLAVGSGRTTVCEVQIRSTRAGDGGAVGLLLEPLSIEEMTREIVLYAEDEWARKQTDTRRPSEEDADPTSLEVHRAIRGMTGYVERQETYFEGGLRRKKNIWPLDEVIPRYPSAKALAEHIIERANLGARIETTWWWPTRDEEDLRRLKTKFEEVNRGLEPTAMLPGKMTVVVPEPLPGSMSDLSLTLVDTRGLDGSIESRGDLLRFLRDPRSTIVICGSFKAAPDDTVRAVLRTAANSADTRCSLKNALLVLVDTGDAEQVNGADGDRDFGQQIKIDECVVALEAAGFADRLPKDQIVAFDALNDSRLRLIKKIDARLAGLRARAEEDLQGLVRDAEEFVGGAPDPRLPALRRQVDDGLKAALAGTPPSGTPLRDPLQGAYEAIRDCRFASVVYATCRRGGTYAKLDMFTAVGSKAVFAAMDWLAATSQAVEHELSVMERDEALAPVQDHLRLRKRQFDEGELGFIRDYGRRVQTAVQERLHGDEVWQACSAEWRQGSGFKNRVLGHLESWSRRQQDLTAHETVRLEDFLPLYAEAMRPAQAPRFTLHVRNLRALRAVSFQPAQVCALIGANGTGKTTLLETLRLLRVAYDRGLSEAVNVVFKGGSNLKSWGAPEEEPIEVGVDLGEVRWRIQLLPRDGSVADVTQETLVDRGRVVFQRDSLGGFTYGEERIEGTRSIGLRALMDRGAHEPAIRRVAELLQSIHVHRDPDLVSLRDGSRTTDDRALNTRGTNALTMLRRWHQERANRHRYDFVLEGLDAAFPNRVSDIDFREAGNNLVANIYRPGFETPSSLADEANGVLQMLVLLCQVAAADDQTLVAIDEPENGLHPYALRTFFRRASQWAREHNVTIVLATHSTVLLDRLGSEPEQVYVMKSKEPGGPVPTRLDILYDRSWLEEYVLGDLYERGEIGSNEDLV